MNVKEIIYLLSKKGSGLSQSELAAKLGYKGQTAIAVPLSRDDGMGMKVGTLIRWLEALNAQLIVEDIDCLLDDCVLDGESEGILDDD